MAPILGIPPLLAAMGLNPDRLITEAGLDAARFDDPNNTIPFTDLGRFVALCAERMRCPHFGLLVCRKAGLDILGLVGELALHAHDVGTALNNIILYLHLHDRGAIPMLSVRGERAMLAYSIHQPDVPGTEHIYDGAIANAFNIMKALAGPDWTPVEVLLYRPPPVDYEPYRQFFRTRLTFGAEHSAVVFAASWLDRRLGSANAIAHHRILQEIDLLEAQGAGDMVTQLKRVLRRLLLDGACQREARLETVADLFALHRRTLNRRLSSQGTSFKALVDEARYDVARQLLRDTRLPVTEIAFVLDYTECASFARAFRRWSGTTPSDWRGANARL